MKSQLVDWLTASCWLSYKRSKDRSTLRALLVNLYRQTVTDFQRSPLSDLFLGCLVSSLRHSNGLNRVRWTLKISGRHLNPILFLFPLFIQIPRLPMVAFIICIWKCQLLIKRASNMIESYKDSSFWMCLNVSKRMQCSVQWNQPWSR